MTIIIETGVGVRNAVSYVSVEYVTAYLTARGRETENLWSTKTTEQKEEAIVSATDYLEKRFGDKFKGSRLTSFEESKAIATIILSANPADGDTFTLGDETYKFVSSFSEEINTILIQVTKELTLAATVDALNFNALASGVSYSAQTLQSRHATAVLSGATVTLTALAYGVGGNYTVLTKSCANMAITSFAGGKDGGSQPLSFPRKDAYLDDGVAIQGVPDNVKKAISEYTVRSLAGNLLPDPDVDPYGGSIKSRREEVGPIKEEVKYDSGTFGTGIFKPFPAADKLLTSFLRYSAGVIRG